MSVTPAVVLPWREEQRPGLQRHYMPSRFFSCLVLPLFLPCTCPTLTRIVRTQPIQLHSYHPLPATPTNNHGYPGKQSVSERLRAGKETPFLQNKNALTRALHGLPTPIYVLTHLPLYTHKHLHTHSGLSTPISTPTHPPIEEDRPQARTSCGQEGPCEKSSCCQEGGCQGGW